jgi:anaerobic nitric oxide reductase transcription regulator
MKYAEPILDILVSITIDLTAALSAKERYFRLLKALNRIIPYDAATLLRIEGDDLIPVASRGLAAEAMGRHYSPDDHPRLKIVCSSDQPVRFPADSNLPDPFDGLLEPGADLLKQIHSCLGCPLRANNQLIGVLTADALDPHAFDHLDQRFLSTVGAIAGAQMQTVNLINALEVSAEKQGQIAKDLMRDIHSRQGSEIIGSSRIIEHLKQEISLVAQSDFTVLVLGETGVGKELVVRAIHNASKRLNGPMLYLNCAALPETLADSELFGHTKGSFTGANSDRAGKFEVADGGTLFLDEIGELPLTIQAKLLRAIQEGEIQRVGSEQTKKVDVRLLAATNRDLEKEVETGKFRADLFHRLNVYPIHVPALRERKEDISLLVGYFCERTQRRLGTGPVRLSPETMTVLTEYNWPGNVRELENIISRAVLKAGFVPGNHGQVVIHPVHLGGDLMTIGSGTIDPGKEMMATGLKIRTDQSLREATIEFQRSLIQQRLQQNDHNWAATARELKMHRSNLHNLAKRLGLHL